MYLKKKMRLLLFSIDWYLYESLLVVLNKFFTVSFFTNEFYDPHLEQR